MVTKAVSCILILSLLHAVLPEDVQPVPAAAASMGSTAFVEPCANNVCADSLAKAEEDKIMSKPPSEGHERLVADEDQVLLPDSQNFEDEEEESAVIVSTENRTSEDLPCIDQSDISAPDDESHKISEMEDGQSCTLFLSGLPYDCRAREIYNMFRLFPGFRYSTLHRAGKMLVAFVTFETPEQAIEAGRQVNGTRFDPYVRLSLRVEVAHRTSRIPRDRASKGFIDFTGIITYNPDKSLSLSNSAEDGLASSRSSGAAGRHLARKNLYTRVGGSRMRMDDENNDRNFNHEGGRKAQSSHMQQEQAGREGLPPGISPDMILRQLEQEGQLDASQRGGNKDATSVLIEHLEKLRGIQKNTDHGRQGGPPEVSDTLFLHHIDRTVSQGELLRTFEKMRGFKELRMRSPPNGRLRTAFAEFESGNAAQTAYRDLMNPSLNMPTFRKFRFEFSHSARRS